MALHLSDWFKDFSGAFKTCFVGREEICGQIAADFDNPAPGPRVIFLLGDGGYGKTQIIQKVLGDARTKAGLHATDRMVDFYHTQTHSSVGLVEAIYQALSPSDQQGFTGFFAKFNEMQHNRLSGVGTSGSKQRDETLESFCTDISAFSRGGRLILTLDTLERLNYLPGSETTNSETAECWQWLCKVLAGWGNVTLLVAGRPRAEILITDLQNKGIPCRCIQVGPFSQEDSLKYFSAALATARETGAQEIWDRIEPLSDPQRIALAQGARGRPILLAMLIDLINMGAWKPDEELQVFDLEERITKRLIETPELGDLTIALGRLARGANAALLACVMGIAESEARSYLEQARYFSFVKVPAQNATDDDLVVYLHDELYATLRHHVYASPADAQQAGETYERVLAYYTQRETGCREALNAHYAPFETQGQAASGDVTQILLQRQSLLAETVYYLWHLDPTRGFRRYYRYGREAVSSADIILYTHLQAEMVALIEEHQESGGADFQEEDLALLRELLGTYPVIRAWANKEYEEVVALVDAKLGVQAVGAIVRDDLRIRKTLALIFLGKNLPYVQTELDEIITRLKKDFVGYAIQNLNKKAVAWYKRAILAFAYRTRAYGEWARGALQQATNDYRQASQIWRELNIKVEMAGTLNDLAFAMSESADWQDSPSLVWDAFNLRRALGPRSPVALSLNTIGIIDMRLGRYDSAIDHSSRALGLFKSLNDRRGMGLALIALAEARRRSVSSDQTGNFEGHYQQLKTAREEAGQALVIFDQSGERIRQVEALIEQGCACRDMVRILLKEGERDQVIIKTLIDQSENALSDAAQRAAPISLYRHVDALIDLAWLRFYAKQSDQLEQAIQTAWLAVPNGYLEPENISGGRLDVQIRKLVGKLHTLEGHRAYEAFLALQDQGEKWRSPLALAVRKYALGLEASSQYSPDYPGVRQARDQVYDRFKKLNTTEIEEIIQTVKQFEQERGQTSVMRAFLEKRTLWSEQF